MIVKPMDHYTALIRTHCCWDTEFLQLSVISIDLVLAADPLTVASRHPPPPREKPTLAWLPFLPP